MYTASIQKSVKGTFPSAPSLTTFATFLLILFTLPGVLFADVTIDNGDAGTSSTGTWAVSGGADPYGGSSLWARGGATYTWSFDSEPAGFYSVSLWWTEFSSRGTAVPVQVNYTGGSFQTTVNQQTDGGKWNGIGAGTFYFDGEGSVTLTAAGSYPTSNSADAAQFVLVQANERPIAVINSITPGSVEVGDSVEFDGDASDADGSIVAYEWKTSIGDAVIGTSLNFSATTLSEGTHLITFRAQDDQGVWSAAAEGTVTVGTPSSVEEVIIDDGDAGTSSTGTWASSGGADPYDGGSLWGRSGATYSWTADSLVGSYEVFMWWTEFSSRSNSATVRIDHAGGQDSTTVNQQTDGGDWNSLGEFVFDGSGTVTLVASAGYPTSYSADAVKFVKKEPAPVMADFSGVPTSGDLPVLVTFTDETTGTGTVDTWAWDFDNDGTVDSVLQNPTYTYTVAGKYSVKLVASGPDGSDEIVKTDYIKITDPAAGEVIIIDDGDAGTSSTGTWAASGGADPYEGDSLWAREPSTYRWSFTPQEGGTYEVSLWWTEFSSRGSAVPVTVAHLYGTTDMTVDQQTDGGDWNGLGTYVMNAGQTYYVQVATPGGDSTASADAVRIKRVVVDNIAPNATILSIAPNPILVTEQLTLTGSAIDVDGTVEEYRWESDIDGVLGSQATETVSLSGGVHTISLTAKDDKDKWSIAATKKAVVLDSSEIEPIFVCVGYGSERFNFHWDEWLSEINATKVDDLWIYTNAAQDKSYVIEMVNSIEEMHAAMKTENSHILFYGHSNYGSGAIFPTESEQSNQVIEDLYYMNDDRIFNYSTDTVAVSISGMINSQAYPNWYPINQDGSSAIAPYDFGDPAGDPPHNYYITYQIPGDPNHYKVDSPRESALQRFPDSRTPAWYSINGSGPNSSNPSHHQYFITNPSPYVAPFEYTGGWLGSTKVAGYYGANYLWTDAGSGEEVATWTCDFPYNGDYTISARWASSSGRTAAAPYTVTHADGATTTTVSQRVNGGRWNALGTYRFESGQDWYESRYDDPSLITLNEDDIAGNSSKKAAFEASLSGNAYLTQKFAVPTHDIVRIEWDIYMDSILNDADRDRGGMMLLGTDTGSGPNRGTGPFVYMAFYSPDGGNTAGDPLSILAREPGDSGSDSSQWKEVATGLMFDQWYKVAVECDTTNRSYDVYLNDVLVMADVQGYNNIYDLTHISFAQWNDGAGAFYVDNVSADIPDLLIDNDFDGSVDTSDLLGLETVRYPITLTNDTATGNVIADAVRIEHVSNPADVLQADFYSASRSGSAPLDVRLYNQSTGTTETRTWNFGDGTPSVKTTNNSIIHTYTTPGSYSVTLTVSGAGGTDSVTKANYVTVGGSTPLQPEFSASGREGVVPRAVSFRNRTSGSIKSVLWDFGDGTTSTLSNPYHSYFESGNYDVTLTVTFYNDEVKVLKKENFVRVVVFEKVIDNINYPNKHYGSKTILKRGPLEIDPAEMKYKRMFVLSCNSGVYYMQTLGRGICFYSLDDTEVNPATGFSLYLREYVQGGSNQDMLNALESKQAAFDYYDFNKRPDQQQ